jgi:hypothetical protein
MKISTCVPQAIAICFVFGAQVEEAKAQPSLGENRPAFSPYLNLLRPGGSTTLNYFGLVNPQLDFMNAAGSLQQQITTQQSLSQGASSLQTGHAAVFMNLGGYFQTIRAGGGAGGNQGIGGGVGQGQIGNAGLGGGIGGQIGGAGLGQGQMGGQFAPQAPLR